MNNANEYRAYLSDYWKNITDKEKELGHGGMDYFMCREFIEAVQTGTEMPIDVYDAAAWAIYNAAVRRVDPHGAIRRNTRFHERRL